MSTKTSRVGAGVLAVAAVVLPGLLLSCDGVQWSGAPPGVGVSAEALTAINPAITADTELKASSPDTNYNSATSITLTNTSQAVMRFDTAATAIPADAQIQSALLTIRLVGGCVPGQLVELRRLGQAWTPSSATYNCATDLAPSTPGTCGSGGAAWGSLNSGALAAVSNCVSGGTTLTFDVNNDIQNWVVAGGSHHGWWINNPGSNFTVASRESATPPTLSIVFATSGEVVSPPVLPTAPPLDSNTPTSTYDATRFIWDPTAPGVPVGSNVQIGVAANAISRDRAAHLRGRVYGFAASPVGATENLPSVEVAVLGRPELGRTFTRMDGLFDLVINGGGAVTLTFRKPGMLEAQRSVNVAWGGAEAVPDVVLRNTPSECTSALNSGSSGMFGGNTGGTWQISDARGTRNISFYVPSGTTITPTSGGAPSSWNLCFDEFTREVLPGANDLSREAAMPADIATNTGYTYAFEGQVRSGTTNYEGARFTNASSGNRIFMYMRSNSFSAPLSPTTDSLNFPPGTIIPFGTYDRATATWVPASDGVVMEVVRGSGSTCTYTPLPAGMTTNEQSSLCGTVPVNTTQRFWRVPIEHFTPCDPNFAQIVPEVSPTLTGPSLYDNNTCRSGSQIYCQSRSLGERVPVVGLGQELVYNSGNQRGRTEAYSVAVRPRPGSLNPNDLVDVKMRLEAAGQIMPWQTMSASDATSSDVALNTRTLTWDGLDAFLRPIVGVATATVRLRYTYNVQVNCPAAGGLSTPRRFGSVTINPTGPICSTVRATREREFQVQLGTMDARIRGLGGLTLSEHHAYDPQERMLYMGDGSRRSYDGTGSTIRRFYQTADMSALAVAPNGDVFFAVNRPGDAIVLEDPPGVRRDGIFRLSSAGAVTQVYVPTGLHWDVTSLAVSPTGIVYAGDQHCVFQLSPNASGILGLTRTIGQDCGNDNASAHPAATLDLVTQPGASAATNVMDFEQVTDVMVHRDGSLYIADNRSQNLPNIRSRIVRFVPDASDTLSSPPGGRMHFVSRDAATGPAYLGSLASTSEGDILRSYSRAVAPGGGFEGGQIDRVDSQGRVSTVVGAPGTGSDIRDGLTAAGYGYFIADQDFTTASRGGLAEFGGDIFFSNYNLLAGAEQDSILRLDARTGRVFTYVGPPVVGISVGGAPQIQQGDPLAGVTTVPVGARTVRGIGGLRMDFDFRSDGAMFFLTKTRLGTGVTTIFVVESANESGLSANHMIGSEDGSVIYEFSPAGQHLRTLDGATGARRWAYDYDAQGRIRQITDPEGQLTQVTYPTATSVHLVAPGALTTYIYTAGSGYANAVIEPSSRYWTLNLGFRGLMSSFQEPGDTTEHTFTYESGGLLSRDTGIPDLFGGAPPWRELSSVAGGATPTAPEPNYSTTRLTHSTNRYEEFRVATEEGSVSRRTSAQGLVAPSTPITQTDSESTQRGSDTMYERSIRRTTPDSANSMFDAATYTRFAIDPRGAFDATRYAAETRVCMPGHPTPANCTETAITGASDVLTVLHSRTQYATGLVDQTNVVGTPDLFARTRLVADTTAFGSTQRVDSVLSTSPVVTGTGAEAGTRLTTSVYYDLFGRVRRIQAPYRWPVCVDYSGSNQRPSRIYQGNYATCSYVPGTTQRTTSFSYSTQRWLTTLTNGAGGTGTTTTTILPVSTRGIPSQVTLPGRSAAVFEYGLSNVADTLTTLTPPGHTPSTSYAFAATQRDLPRTFTPPLTTHGTGPEITSTLYDDEERLERVNYRNSQYVDPVYEPITGFLTALNTPEGNWVIDPDHLGRTESMVLGTPYSLTHSFTYGGASSTLFSPTETVTAPGNGPTQAAFGATLTTAIGRTTGRVVSRTTTMGTDTAAVEYNYAPLNFGSNPFLTQSLRRSGTLNGTTLQLRRPSPTTLSGEGDHDEFSVVAGSYTTTVRTNGFGELVSNATNAMYTNTICSRDAAGRIRSRIELINESGVMKYRRYAYTYNTQTRLDSAITYDHGTAIPASPVVCGATGGTVLTNLSYTYDVNTGNRVFPSSAYNADDQITARSGFTYGWDARGRMTSRTPSFGFGTGFIWNSLGQMTRSTVQGFPSTVHNYEYDGRGRLVAIRTGSAATDQFFVYGNQTEPVAWVRGTEQQFYVYGSQRHVPDLIYVNNTGDAAIDAVYRVLTDERGSVRLVVNVSGGAVVQRIEYDPWGVPTYSVGFGVQPFGYAGAIQLQAGLWHMGARNYDPAIGRWMSRDPIGFGGGMNLYEYAGNDPVNFVDITGEYAEVIHVGGNNYILLLPVIWTNHGFSDAEFETFKGRVISDTVAGMSSHGGPINLTTIIVSPTQQQLDLGRFNRVGLVPRERSMGNTDGFCSVQSGYRTTMAISEGGYDANLGPHEFGHAAGLPHITDPTDIFNTMHPDRSPMGAQGFTSAQIQQLVDNWFRR